MGSSPTPGGSKENLCWVESCSDPKLGCHLRNVVSSWPSCPYLKNGDKKAADLWSHGASVRLKRVMKVKMFDK